MCETPEVIEARKDLISQEAALGHLYDRADDLQQELEEIEGRIEAGTGPFRIALEKALEKQSRRLGPWVHSGTSGTGNTRYALYHKREFLTEHRYAAWDTPWLRYVGGVERGERLKPQLRFIAPNLETRGGDIVLKPGTHEELFAQADVLLIEAGWILTEEPLAANTEEGQSG